MLVAYTILCWLVFWFCSDIFSNEVSYLKVHYDLEVLPDDRSTLSKYNSDVCKWHLFVSNITEDVFQLLIDIFTLDYSRTLRFQTFDATDAAPQQSEPLPASATDDILKGFLCTWKESHIYSIANVVKVLMENWQQKKQYQLCVKFWAALSF